MENTQLEKFNIINFKRVKQNIKGFESLKGGNSHNQMIKYLFGGKDFTIGDIFQHRVTGEVVRYHSLSMGYHYVSPLLKNGKFSKTKQHWLGQTQYVKLINK